MNSNSPLIIEVARGGVIESTHLVDVIVTDADSTAVNHWGNFEEWIYPRSSNKALQALPLVESGAADAFGLDDCHLALACSSHNGEPIHTAGAREILAAAGVSETCLECGAQLPKRPEDHSELVRKGIQVSAIHNNCSGKHAGFLAFAAHAGINIKGYIGINHPVQREIANTLEQVTGSVHGYDNHGIDGCSIPTFKIPLKSLAQAFARFGIGKADNPSRERAMLRLRDACMRHPEMVAGTERVCTQLMQALPGRVFVKVGAEGVYTAALPELGYGIAMKARDGSFRAVEVAVSKLAEHYLELDDLEVARLKPLTKPILKNWNGFEVGSIKAVL